jgi:hypothetical protein
VCVRVRVCARGRESVCACVRDVRVCVCVCVVCVVVRVRAPTVGCVRKLIALLCGLMLFAADAVAAAPVLSRSNAVMRLIPSGARGTLRRGTTTASCIWTAELMRGGGSIKQTAHGGRSDCSVSVPATSSGKTHALFALLKTR